MALDLTDRGGFGEDLIQEAVIIIGNLQQNHNKVGAPRFSFLAGLLR
jgi:hypothetical protein